MIKFFVSRNFDKLIRFVLDEYGLNSSWRVIVLDDDECKLFFYERINFITYKDEFFDKADVVDEWDDGDPKTHDSFYACCIPCFDNYEDIIKIKEGLDQKRLETFNSETNFIQKLFYSYRDVDHLILINDESFSGLLNVQWPEIIGHEAFHIVEYELYDQTHKGEEVYEYGKKLADQYIASLTVEQRKSEFKKICSHEKGRGKYGKLRIITKFNIGCSGDKR